MPEMVLVFIRSLIAFLVLFIMARLMGKKQIAQLTFFDYIVGISIGSIAAAMSLNPSVTILNGLSALIVWGLFPLIIGYLSVKSYRFRLLAEGKPTVLVEKGKILEENLFKEKLTVDDLLTMLRANKAFKLSDVEFAILETNGKMSVMKKSDAQSVSAKKLGLTVEEEHDPRIVIIDGHVMNRTLQEMGYDRNWLLGEIVKQGASNFEDVFLAQLESNGKLYVDLKSDRLKIKQPPERIMIEATMEKVVADLQSFALETQDQEAKNMYQEQAKKMRWALEMVQPYMKK